MSCPSIPAREEDEESLMTGIDRRLERFGHVQQQMTDFGEDLFKLKASCDALKVQRSSLVQDCAAITQEKESLASHVDKLKSERDSLQLEYAQMMEENKWWHDAEANNTMELEATGRVHRMLWLQTEKVNELQNKLTSVEAVHADELEAEAGVAAGLRERISRLESKLRGKSKAKVASMEREDSGSGADTAHSLAVAKDELAKIKSDLQDARDGLDALEKKKTTADTRADTLAEQLHRAREEILELKSAKLSPPKTSEMDVVEYERLKIEVKRITSERDKLKSEQQSRAAPPSPRALQPLSPNLSVPPQTPTKTPAATPSKVESFTPSASLAKRYAHLEDQHTRLKSAYDALKTKYRNDLRHWSEYRAVQQARDELRNRRKEARRTNTAAQSAMGSSLAGSSRPGSEIAAAPDVPMQDPLPPTSPMPMGSGNANPRQPAVVVQVNEEAAFPPAPPPRVVAVAPPPQSPLDVPAVAEDSRPNPRPTRGVSAPQPSTLALAKRHSISPAAVKATVSTPAQTTAAATGPNTPSVTDTAKHLSRQPTKVTPWISAKTTSKRSLMRRRDSFGSDDDYDPSPAPAPSTSRRTPLVRDRTGDGGDLRRSALHHTTTHIDSAGDVSMDATPSKPNKCKSKSKSNLRHSHSHHSISNAGGEVSPETLAPSRKRSLLTDHEGLTPDERKKQRREIFRLPTSERRELYSGFKGNGRYLPPEEVARTVADDYEIDPARNGGVAHQYGEVVRGREERRKMDGTDCDCCKGYYQAIGELPKFNEGPRWRSQSPPKSPSKDGSGGVAERGIEDHLNRVSRHREAWRKPDTPPDYWKIGFPTTQEVSCINAQADEMTADKEARLRREAAHKDGKWRKK